ncbi:MAG: protein kinase/lanthionine synthetase C family protein [Catenulispora sp.]|nr:protein kinase/lanthionine synthetase C family protein [Catenulispora sp.]
MPPTEALRSYVIADERFYEPLGNARLADDIRTLIQDRIGGAAQITDSGIWTRCRPHGHPKLPAHGWKIHVAATPDHAPAAADAVCREFEKAPFAFKILRDTGLVTATAARWWPRGSAGKVVTVYSGSPEECRELLERFEAAFAAVDGPYVLSDRRYGASRSVHYRYGEFLRTQRVRPDGRHESVITGPGGEIWHDSRSPAYRRPPWVADLFVEPGTGDERDRQQADQDGAAAEPSPLSRYRIIRPLHRTAAGAVYLAETVADGRRVILKEARPHTAFSPDGADSPTRLRREFESLQQVAHTGVGPRPIDLFTVWEHLFLAEEWIEGLSLLSFIALRNPLAQGDLSGSAVADYRRDAQRVLDNVRKAIEALHGAGFVYGDLSLTNIIVDPVSLEVRLIDFEACRPLDAQHDQYPRTRGFCPPEESEASRDGRLFDEAGLAGVELALVFPRNDLIQLDPGTLVRSTRHAAALLGMPAPSTLGRLGITEDAVASAGQGPAIPATDPTALREAVRRGLDFVLGTMTPDRTDLLFPADPALFATNPFGLAHGAAGVLRAVHRLTGDVPAEARDWLARSLPDQPSELAAGLHFGWAGIAVAMTELGDLSRAREIFARAAGGLDSIETADIATGLAGIGMAGLVLWQAAGDEQYLETALRAGRLLIRRAEDDGTGIHWSDPYAPHRTTGFASGSSGIATFLLYLHCAVERERGGEEFLRVGRRALQFDLATARTRPTGIGFPGLIDARPIEPYWSRGSAGVGSAILRYLRVTGEPVLRDLADRLLPPTLTGIAANPGLFSGMAGIANLALDHDQLLGGDRYRPAAESLGAAILALSSPQPEGLAFPGNFLLRYSVDYATGSAGILLLLDRLARRGADFTVGLDDLLAAGSRQREAHDA